MTDYVPNFDTIPRLAGGRTVVIIGGGPSLTVGDVVLACLSGAFILGINDAYRIAGRLGALYGCDARWWDWHPEVADLDFPLFTTAPEVSMKRYPKVKILRRGADLGLDPRPGWIATGSSSGYQAIGLAVHLGASRIVLLGYDYKVDAGGPDHWFGDHPQKTPPETWATMMIPKFSTIVAPLAKLGIEILNATPGTALHAFPETTIERALSCE